MKEYFSDDKRISKFKDILFSWLGTPYKHRGRCKGRAADCTLFIAECGIEMGIYKKIDYGYYPRDWHIVTKQEIVLEGIENNKKNLNKGLQLKEIPNKEQLKFGDWLVFSVSPQGVSNHSGIYLGDNTFISALNEEGVCIKKLSKSWTKAIKHILRLYEKSIVGNEDGVVAIPLIMGAAAAGAASLAGAGALVMGLAFTAGATLGSYLFPSGQSQSDMHMKPASLADFQITQSNEGQPIPLTYGTVKIPGNIIYYGNLVVERQTEEVKGGKGHHHSKKQTTGYKYFLDNWQAIAYGKVDIVDTYVGEDKKAVSCSYSVFNDGTGDEKPIINGLDYVSKLKGISHIFYKKMYTGSVGNTFLPTVSYVIRKYLPNTIHYANMYGSTNYGNNPAAIIYDILTEHCGISSNEIDINSFNNCADSFYNDHLGLNFTFSSQKEAKEMIPYILTFVDATLYLTDDNKIGMRIFRDTDSYSHTIDNDFIDFSASKPFWGELPNDFRGAIVDSSKDYSVRSPLAVRNTANIEQVNQVRQKTVDLTAFEDRTVAFKKIYTTMKRESYPSLGISITTTRKYSNIKVGDVVRIVNNDYNIDGAFRVTKKVDEELDKNMLAFDLLQLSSFDSVFIEPESQPIPPVAANLKPLTQIKVFELPYNAITGTDPAYWILASEEVGVEAYIAVYISTNGTDYTYYNSVGHFAVAGTLKEDYPSDTYEIDDTQGILFEPYRDFLQFENISRADLFLGARAALIGDELVLFQNYDPEDETYYRLTGVVRGAGYQKAQSHSIGEKVFVFYTKDFELLINRTDTFYLKLVPVGISENGTLEDATAIKVTPQFKAKKPYPVARITAERVSSSVDILVFPVLKTYLGSGMQAANSYTDEYPFNFMGDILYKIDNGNWINNGNSANINITQTGQFTIYVKHKMYSYESEVKSLVVGSADGSYIGNYD